MTHFFGIADYMAFVIAFVVLLFIPGPGNLAIMTSAAKGGILGGTAATLGLLLGDQVLMWLAVAGVAAIMTTHPTALAVVQWLGAAYLAYLGIKMLLAKPGGPAILNIRPRQYLQQAFFITLLNPKAIVFYMAFFPIFIDPKVHQGMVTFGVMAITIAVLGFVYCFGVVVLTHFFAERLRANPKLSSALQKFAGCLLLGFGIRLALGR